MSPLNKKSMRNLNKRRITLQSVGFEDHDQIAWHSTHLVMGISQYTFVSKYSINAHTHFTMPSQ